MPKTSSFYIDLMHQIHFHSDFYLPIKEGKKTQTARYNEIIPTIGKAEAIFDDLPSIPIKITKVKEKRFSDINTDEVLKDGFETKQELLDALLTFYPDLKTSDRIVLIQFQRI